DFLHLAKQFLAAVVRLRELRIRGEHDVRAAVQLEVHRAAAEMLVQLLDLALALLPAGGHGRDVAFDAERAHRVRERRPKTLRSQERESGRNRRRAHRARTFTVSPTASSIWRSSS